MEGGENSIFGTKTRKKVGLGRKIPSREILEVHEAPNLCEARQYSQYSMFSNRVIVSWMLFTSLIILTCKFIEHGNIIFLKLFVKSFNQSFH